MAETNVEGSEEALQYSLWHNKEFWRRVKWLIIPNNKETITCQSNSSDIVLYILDFGHLSGGAGPMSQVCMGMPEVKATSLSSQPSSMAGEGHRTFSYILDRDSSHNRVICLNV